jgi:hypothetical protein
MAHRVIDNQYPENSTLHGKLGLPAVFGYYASMKNFYRTTTGAILLYALFLAAMPRASAEVQTFTDETSGLLSWKAQHPGFSLQFIQLLPDYVRAVYSARGLPEKVVELMAGQCIFGTIVKNESDQPLSYRVADWRYITQDGQSHPIKTKTEWLKHWQEMGVNFRYSLLPDDQRFAPGDWSQGFTTLPLPPDTLVTLRYSWTLQGKKHEGILKNLRCAPVKPPRS